MGNLFNALNDLKTNIFGGGNTGKTTPILRKSAIGINEESPVSKLDHDPFAYSSIQYPRETINLKPIDTPLQHMDLFMTNLEPYQESIYRYIIQNFNKKEKKKSFEELDSFGYNDLQYPIEALNIVYPIEDFNDKSKIPVNQLVGKTGLSRILDINYGKNGEQIKQYKYNPSILEKFGRIFSLTEIGKYSSKIFSICKGSGFFP